MYNEFIQCGKFNTHANVTIVFDTTQDNGVLLYKRHQEHYSVVLFSDRVRISYGGK